MTKGRELFQNSLAKVSVEKKAEKDVSPRP
jgi:hypothetical protein